MTAVAIVVVKAGTVPEVIVTVSGGTEGSMTSTIEVVVPPITVATVVVNTGNEPETIVVVVGGTEGSTT